jgi:uncharacterized protein
MRSMRRIALFLFALAPAMAQSVVISQIYGGGGNAGAAYRNDFVELFHRGEQPVDLSGWSVQYASATGAAWQVNPLQGTIEPGQYFLVQMAAGAGGTRDLPEPDGNGNINMSATAGKVALVRNANALIGAQPARDGVADFVGYGAAASDSSGAPTRDLSNTTAAARNQNGCADSGNNQADFTIAAPAPRNSASPRNLCGGAPPPAQRLIISQIQGAGDLSPYAGKPVITRGVVYAVRSNGFYIQSLPEDDDRDPKTSEGLLVFTGTAPPPEARPGNVLDVEGTVVEFRPAADPESPPLTELTGVTLAVLAAGFALPVPTPLSGDGDWERFEGMRVTAPLLNVTGPTGGTFSDAAGASTPNGVVWGVFVNRQRPFRRAGLSGDEVPARLRVDMRLVANVTPAIASPTVIENLTGPLDYASRSYTLLPELVSAPPLNRAPRPAPAPEPGELLIASLNLQRFFSGAQQFPARLDKARRFVTDILRSPDVVAVQEAGTLNALEQLATTLGGGYRAFLGTTNDPSGIALGFLVKSATMTVESVTALGETAINPGDNQLLHDRPPLLLTATVASRRIQILNVHLRSLTTVTDPRIAAKRRAQAEAVNQMAASLAANPHLILGDFNAFGFDDGYGDLVAIAAQGRGMTHLTALLKGGDEYSYVFNGSTQTLDHILASASFRPWITRVHYTRANADFPENERANTASPARLSDHEAALLYFRPSGTAAFTALGVTGAATFRTGAVAPGELITVFGTFPVTAPRGLEIDRGTNRVTSALGGLRLLIDGRPAPMLYVSATQISAVVPFQTPPFQTVTIAVEAEGRVLHQTTVLTDVASPALFTTSPSAPPGGVMVFYGSGGGLYNLRFEDGAIPPGAVPLSGINGLRLCGEDAQVLYSGAAPGLVAGVVQINARVPESCRPGLNLAEFWAGSRTSAPIAVTIR